MCSSSRGLLSWCDLKNREADQGVGSPQATANLCEFLREIVKGGRWSGNSLAVQW